MMLRMLLNMMVRIVFMLAKALFASGGDDENMPTTSVTLPDGEAIGLLELLCLCGLAKSNGEARRLVQQGGIMLGSEKISDPALKVPKSRFEEGSLLIKKGKKTYHKAVLETNS